MATYDHSEAASQPCVTFKTCGGHGTLPHQAWGISGGAAFVSNEVHCVRCGEYLYSYNNREFGPHASEAA